MNKVFRHRYGDVFPDDDAGLEDLKILAHHYYWGNPLATARIIKLRAPWADADAIQDEIIANPRKWTSKELGVGAIFEFAPLSRWIWAKRSARNLIEFGPTGGADKSG